MTADTPDELHDLAALAAAGALSAEERAAFDADPGAVAALAGWEGALLALAEEIPPGLPSPTVREQLLAKVAPLPDGHTVLHPDADGFRPTRFPGIAVRVLYLDRPRRQFACLMRIAPGARLPHHPHAVAEECVVLEGSLQVGGVRMGPGAYQRVEAGVEHVDQWSDTGATVYLNAPLELLDTAAWNDTPAGRA